ncbi:MAG: efflux RND transporter periplasmic adaptor subunit [Nostoc sp. DedQUE08]|uniref:efflux RND transporter periplasmic adaptor subunit n=1 Tax=Nostoc sp. DedQUE08 TaxID=3075393 RepID=UPI002AD446B9|nr:efflux RND transporter periplasmic adaptor subunit [Nostoc sp. DedQUE08]MDZ8065968.1 efflux RND transporter periplasmic adaptor subunit [Nostoc sp. DedQUE08]
MLKRNYLLKHLNFLLANPVLVIVLMLTALTSGCQKNDPAANAQSPPALPVKLQRIDAGTIEESSEFVGSLEAQQKVILQPQTQGRIESILVSSGQRVQQGTPIASLSLDQAQANVASLIAAANSVQAALATAQAEQQQAEAQRTKAAANVQLQQTQFNRTQQLVGEGAVARQESDIGRNNLQTAQADLQTSEKQVAAARAAVRQAQANIRQAQASTAAARVSLNFKQVVAPITGVVGEFPVKVGDYVNIGQTITTLTQNDSLDLNLSIPSNRSRQLRTNLPVQLIDPTTQQVIGTGAISYISPNVSSNQQSVLSKARFRNSQGRLRDGQYVRARVIWNRQPGILIPTVAISRIGGQSFVFVTENKTVNGQQQQVVHQRLVRLGDIQGPNYQVIDGLKSGETIVTSGILKLREGAPIQPVS